MSDDYNTYTRINRYEKKRKSTKTISWLLILGAIMVIFLIGLFVFGDKDNTQVANGNNGVSNETEDTGKNDSSKSNQTNGQTKENEKATNPQEQNKDQDSQTDSAFNQNPNEIEVQQVPSDDENVLKAYTADWKPIGTDIEEPFSFSWDQKSQDWKELLKACALATGLAQGDIIDWWVTNNGPNRFIATVTNKAQTENYRVYISWVENKGFKPTKVEILKENDQKYRFEDDSSSETESTQKKETNETSESTATTEDETAVDWEDFEE